MISETREAAYLPNRFLMHIYMANGDLLIRCDLLPSCNVKLIALDGAFHGSRCATLVAQKITTTAEMVRQQPRDSSW